MQGEMRRENYQGDQGDKGFELKQVELGNWRDDEFSEMGELPR